MKIQARKFEKAVSWSLAIAGILMLTLFQTAGAEASGGGAGFGTTLVSDGTNGSPAPLMVRTSGGGASSGSAGLFVADEHLLGHREMTWLGVTANEAPDVLSSQLGLDPGVGLVVAYVMTNSPAAKAGLHKNDVLVEFNGQPLVHPAQLRKLVQVRKEGEVVKLMFYRAGKKQTVSATLAKTINNFGFPDGFPDGQGYGGLLQPSASPFAGSPDADAFRQQMEVFRKQMSNVRIDQKKVQEEIRRNLQESQKMYGDALRQASNANPQLKAALDAELKSLAAAEASINPSATITVRSSGRTAKSLVTTDDSGTIVLVRNPKLYLTAHDQNGNLLFDGEIDTAAERAKVPADLWNKVEPLLKKMTTDAGDPSDSKTVPAPEPPSPHNAGSSS